MHTVNIVSSVWDTCLTYVIRLLFAFLALQADKLKEKKHKRNERLKEQRAKEAADGKSSKRTALQVAGSL